MTRKVFFSIRVVVFGILYQTNIKRDAWKSCNGPAICKGVLESVAYCVVGLATSANYTRYRREDDEEVK